MSNETPPQEDVNILYEGFRDNGDDALNASLRLMDFAGATEEQALEARRAYGDPDDPEEDDEDEP